MTNTTTIKNDMNIVPGTYRGTWTGWDLTLSAYTEHKGTLRGGTFTVEMPAGIRGSVACRVYATTVELVVVQDAV